MRLLLEVCSVCQYKCKGCAHLGLRNRDPNYQMSMEEVQNLVSRLRELDLKLDELHIHGPGEPLLWDNLNIGLRFFHQCGLIDRITVVTNGLSFGKIDEDVWGFIHVIFSRYPEAKYNEDILEAHQDKIEIADRSKFYFPSFPHAKFNGCNCSGPMLYKDKIYPWCGPPLFDALDRSNKEDDYSVPLKEWDPRKVMAMDYDICLWCWANIGASYAPNEAHKIRG